MRIITLLLFLSSSIVSYTQEVYNYNQNYQINEFVKEGEFKLSRTYQTYDGKKTVSQGKFMLTKIDLGYKDLDGNKAFALQMIRGRKLLFSEDTIYLMPDNKFYPTHLEGIRYNQGKPENFGKFIILNGGEITQANIRLNDIVSHGSFNIPQNYVIYFERDKPEFVFTGNGSGQVKSSKDFMSKLGIQTQTTGGSFGSYYTKVKEYPGATNMMEARNTYMDQLIEKANNLDYSKEMSELISKDEYVVYGADVSGWVRNPAVDKLRLVWDKDANGIINSLKVQKPFTDGKFYDKEKFFVECSKGSNGLYSYKGEKDTYTLIPYDGYIVGCINIAGEWEPDFVLASKKPNYPKLLDFNAHLIASGNHSGFGNKSSATWWCKTQLEENYNTEKDEYYFRRFFDNYVKALIK